MTSSQSPRRRWRNRRAVGYQGLSSRSVSHRHSAAQGQHYPSRLGQGPGQVRHRRVAGDDEVQVDHGGGGVGEVGEAAAKIAHPVGQALLGQLAGPVVFPQGIENDPWGVE